MQGNSSTSEALCGGCKAIAVRQKRCVEDARGCKAIGLRQKLCVEDARGCKAIALRTVARGWMETQNCHNRVIMTPFC